MPTTLSAMAYFFTRGCDEMPIEITWNLRSGEARMVASIHDATPPRI